MELIRDTIKVELESIGEGYYGDYDPGNPADVPLLRFTVLKLVDGEWEQIDDASYCTELPEWIDNDYQMQVLTYIMDEVYDAVVGGASIKKRCELLSWIK